jgi:hypothetical protein
MWAWILESVPLDYGSKEPDPALFFSSFQDANKIFFIIKFFCLLLNVLYMVHLYKSFKKSLSHKTAEIKVFFYFLLVDNTARIQSRTNDYNFGFGGPIKLTDPMNPDPELWI